MPLCSLQVLDKMHARAKGPRVTLTRQPTEGRSRDGGLCRSQHNQKFIYWHGISTLIVIRGGWVWEEDNFWELNSIFNPQDCAWEKWSVIV